MVIAIDASRAINESAGIGRFTLELVRNLIKHREHKFILIFTFFRDDSEKEKQIDQFRQENVEIRFNRIPGELKERLWGVSLPVYNWLYKGADILLAPTYFEFKNGLKIPQVVVIHDMATFLFPGQRGRRVSAKLNRRTRLASEKAKKIIAISEATKKDIVDILKVEPDKVEVVYPGLKKFEKIARDIPEGLNSKEYILFVGTLEPRKNLVKLYEAFKLLPNTLQEKYPLVITGAKGWNIDETVEKLKNDPNVKLIGRVEDTELGKLYQEAAVVAYPSLYEGFGLPVIEAMQFGTPVVTSNLSALPESAGNAGVLINPNDEKALARALQDVLEGNISKSELNEKGRAQADKFTWGKAAGETLDILEEAFDV